MSRLGILAVSVALASGERLHAQPAAVQRGPAYLAYAGPYSGSPSSAFGHLFLILADSPDEPIGLSEVVTFRAVTFDVDPLRYLTIGMFGGFLGRYSRDEFHRTAREYSLLDDRDLWLVELRVSPVQRARLEAALRRTEGQWYPYSFLSRNCAYYLQTLLAEATGVIEAPSGVVSPTGVMSTVIGTSIGGRSFTRASASKRIETLGRVASPGAIDRLQNAWYEAVADTAWVATLAPNDRRIVQELVHLRSSAATASLNPATTDGIGKLRVLAAIDPTPTDDEEPVPGREIAPLKFHRYTRLRTGYLTTPSAPARMSLQIRGSMHDEFDPWVAHEPVSTMEFLSLEVSSSVSALAPRLESVVLVSQRALVPSSWVKSRPGWLVELQGRRGGLLAEDRLHGELRAGFGQAWSLPGKTWLHGLATSAVIVTGSHGATVAPGAEAGITGFPSSWLRLGVRWSEEHDMFSWDRTERRVRAWSRLDVSSRAGLNLIAAKAAGRRAYTIALDWYP